MSKAKYYHLYANNKTIKEISAEEWYYNRRFNKPILVVRVVGDEVWLAKGTNSIHVRTSQLDKIKELGAKTHKEPEP